MRQATPRAPRSAGQPVGSVSGCVLRSGCGYQFAGDAGCPVIDLRPVAEVAFGKSRAGGRELAKRPLGEGQLSGVQRTEEDVVTARVQCLGELGNLFRHCHRAQVPALDVGGFGAERPLLNSHTGRAARTSRLRRTNSVASLRQWNSYAALPITKAS